MSNNNLIITNFLFLGFVCIISLKVSHTLGLRLASSNQSWDLENGNKSNHRNSRFLFIQLQQPEDKSVCTGTGSNSNELGMCMKSRTICENRGGSVIGTCGKLNKQTCCLLTFTPKDAGKPIVIREKAFNIKSNTAFSDNRFTITQLPGHCQIKLEFKQFNFDNPDTNNVCVTDRLFFRNTETVKNGFVLCGSDVSDEMPFYLSFKSGTSNEIRINSRSQNKKSYEIRISQVDCNSEAKVNPLCLFQYPEGNGEVRSIGYGAYQIVGQEYNVCIGSEPKEYTWDMCSPATTDGKATNTFHLSILFGNAGGLENVCYRTSYVSLPSRSTFCGAYFPKTRAMGSWPNLLTVKIVQDDVQPFMSTGREAMIIAPNPNLAGTECIDDNISPAGVSTMITNTAPIEQCQSMSKGLGDPGPGGPEDNFYCSCILPPAPIKPIAPNAHSRPIGFCLKYSS